MDTFKAFAWLLFMLQIMSSSLAYEFQAGGKDGWVLNPHESYTQWSGRNRFQVHDKLVFKYNKGEDSVLLVSKEDYDKCTVSNPIKKFDDGNSVFEFDRTGSFFFISGAPGKCSQGQKLSLVVLSLKTKKPNTTPPAPSPTSSVSSQPPSSSQSPSSAASSQSPSSEASSQSPSSASSSQSPSSEASSPSPSASAASSPSASPEASPTPSISISPSATMGSPLSSQSPSPSSEASSGVPSSLSPDQSSEPTNVGSSSPGSSPVSPQSPAPAMAATWMSFGWVTLVFCGLFLG